MFSISDSDFCGKAAARLARPMRCSLSRGPRVRMNAAATSAIDLRSMARIVCSAPMASQPSSVSMVALSSRPACGALREIMRAGCRASKTDDDLPEHLPAFKAGQSPIEFGKRDLGVDHWQEPARHLGETLADIAQGGTERSNDPILLLKELHEVEGGRWPGRCAAGHKASAALEAEQRAVERLRSHMLEHNVNA